MKIINNSRNGNSVAIEVETEYSNFETAIEKAYDEIGREIKIQGFRPGKAPRKMVEQAVNRETVVQQAAQDLIGDLYPQIIKDAKLEPVDYPNVEIKQLESGKPFLFKLTVDVYPNVKLGKYQGLKVEKKSAAVTEEEILALLGRLQERFAVTNAEGKKELLSLDDEFAKKVSSFGTLAELKEEVKTTMLKDKEAEVEADLRNKLVAEAITKAEVELPGGMIEREIDVMLDELAGSLSQNNLTVDDYLKGTKKQMDGLRQEMRKAAEGRVKGKVVLKAVAEKEELKVTDDDIKKELNQISAETGQPVDLLEKNFNESGRRGFMEEYLMRQKALDLLVEKAEIKAA
ncbi:MAG: trigger factor [Candidatus Margulisiibacteriota bacterium]